MSKDPEIKEVSNLKELDTSIKYFSNRIRFYESKERVFQGYGMDLLAEKAGHEIDICRASIVRLKLRKEKLLMLLN